MSSVYKINKGINKPIEFKGLKAQYIAYLDSKHSTSPISQ